MCKGVVCDFFYTDKGKKRFNTYLNYVLMQENFSLELES